MSAAALRFRKIHGGYAVVRDGVTIGYVFASWRMVQGGDCWVVHPDNPHRRQYFTRRKDAAAYLAREASA